MVAAVASTARMPMLAISQKPDRVSNILRSSTPIIRLIGIGRTSGRARTGVDGDSRSSVVAVRVVMLLLLRGWSRAGTPR